MQSCNHLGPGTFFVIANTQTICGMELALKDMLQTSSSYYHALPADS